MQKILIREAQKEDYNTLTILMEQLGYPIEEIDMEENLLLYTSLPHQKAWVAEYDSMVVGCIAVSLTYYFHRKSSFLRVITMIVDKNHRRRGIGKSLMQIAENYAAEKQCSHIELSSGIQRKVTGSHDFYQALGFQKLNKMKQYFGKKIKGEELCG